MVLEGEEGNPLWYLKERRAIPCGTRRRGGQSLVVLEGEEGNPLPA